MAAATFGCSLPSARRRVSTSQVGEEAKHRLAPPLPTAHDRDPLTYPRRAIPSLDTQPLGVDPYQARPLPGLMVLICPGSRF